MPPNKKSTNTHFKQELKRFYVDRVAATHKKDDFEAYFRDADGKAIELLKYMHPHAIFYELTFKELISVLLLSFGMEEMAIECSKEDDPADSLLDLLDDDVAIPLSDEALTNERKGICISIFLAVLGNCDSIALYGAPINRLIKRVKQGDDEALFDAVFADRAALGSPTVLSRIQLAQITRDESFFNSLSKVITRTRPRKPLPKHNDARIVLAFIEDEYGLANFTIEEIYQVVAVDLELYQTTGRDPMEALRKLIQRLNLKVQDMK